MNLEKINNIIGNKINISERTRNTTDISVFGDSVVKGVIYEDRKYRVLKSNFANICEDVLKIRLENKAKFGSTITVGEKSINKNFDLISQSGGKYVVMEFGGNDCEYNWQEISNAPDGKYKPNSTIKEFVEIYTKLINEIKNAGKIPVLLSLPPIHAEKYFQKISQGLDKDAILAWMEGNKQFITNWHERYNIEVFKLAINNEIPIIDITSKFLEEKSYDKFLCEDGIHPNEKGHQIIAKAIKEHIDSKNIVL